MIMNSSDPTNADRADWACEGLEAYGRSKNSVHHGQAFDPAEYDWFSEVAGDFLCDLAHLARQHGHSLREIFERGMCNFRAESQEEDGEFIEEGDE